MAKKKGATLSELNEFLKKDPNSLADVDKLSGHTAESSAASAELSLDGIQNMIRRLARQGNESETQTLLKVILKVMDEKTEENASDILLTNTALYLQHAERTGEKLKKMSG